MKKIICFGLGVFLSLAVLCGVGEAVVTEIWNLQDLDGIRNDLDKDYLLMRDLDFNDDDSYDQTDAEWAAKKTAWTTGGGWSPIGTDASPFTGTFDGDGYMISNLFVVRNGEERVGLLGDVGADGTVKNVKLENGNITGTWYVGGLVGWNEGTIDNSYSTGTISGDFDAGGLAGRNYGMIDNSYSTGNVTGKFGVGGFVGRNYGMIESSYSTGGVEGDSREIGGLVGENYGSIENAYSTGEVKGDGNIGGLVGRNSVDTITSSITSSYSTGNVTGRFGVGGLVGRNDGKIERSYSTGEVEGEGFRSVGGLAGDNYGSIEDSYSTGEVEGEGCRGVGGLVGRNDWTVENSYSTGAVSGDEAVGGLVGQNNEGMIDNSYSTGRVSGNFGVGGLVGENDGTVTNSFYNEETSGRNDTGKGQPKTTAQMKTKSTFTDAGWDFDNIWAINALNDGYPFLSWQRVPSPPRRRRPSAAPKPDPEPDYPLPPEGFNAMPGTGFLPSMKLGWFPSKSPNVAKYNLYASTGPGASSADLNINEPEGLKFWLIAELPADILEYTHTGLSRNVRYYYAVTSVNEEGLESNMSSRILCCVAGTYEISEHEAVSWGPERMTEAPEAEDEDSSTCFIATAVYGSGMSSEVVFLRAFREEFLLRSSAGNCIVQAYYAASPVLAEAVSESNILQMAARLHIAPLASLAGLMTNMN